MSRFAAPIAEQIWDMKYRLKAADGTPIDGIGRRHLAPHRPRAGRGRNRSRALGRAVLHRAGRFQIPARRPHHRRRRHRARSVTLFNCFVMGTIPDNMGGIFDGLKEAALTMQQGGGIGYDFSTIRPRGAEVKGVAADASGPLSFMDVWDAMCRTIMSAGSRAGAR